MGNGPIDLLVGPATQLLWVVPFTLNAAENVEFLL